MTPVTLTATTENQIQSLERTISQLTTRAEWGYMMAKAELPRMRERYEILMRDRESLIPTEV